jgi:hypothetical protein
MSTTRRLFLKAAGALATGLSLARFRPAKADPLFARKDPPDAAGEELTRVIPDPPSDPEVAGNVFLAYGFLVTPYGDGFVRIHFERWVGPEAQFRAFYAKFSAAPDEPGNTLVVGVGPVLATLWTTFRYVVLDSVGLAVSAGGVVVAENLSFVARDTVFYSSDPHFAGKPLPLVRSTH